MTVNLNDTVERYPVSGVGPYPFSMRIFADTDLQVTACSTATPSVPTLLTYLTHYTVTGANAQAGGTVTLTAPVAATYAGYTLDIRTNTPNTQPTSIRNQGRFLPEIHEDAFDHVEREIQDVRRILLSCVRFPDNVLSNGMMTPLASWLSKYLAISSSGLLEPAVLSSTSVTASIITSLIASSTAEQDALLAMLMNRADTAPALGSLARTAGEIAASITPVDYSYPPGHIRRYGSNTTPGTTDMTAAFNSCYAACKSSAGRMQMRLASETYLITSQIVWDGSADIIGDSREFTVIKASGAFYAIKINDNGQESLYENFTVDRVSGAGGGIDIWLGNRITLRRIKVINQNGHGILLRAGNLGAYEDIVVRANTNDGISIASGTGVDPLASAWACRWSMIDAIQNGGWGINFDIGNSHFGMGLICQNNTTGGLRINSNTNVLQVYGENNPPGAGPYTDIVLTATSVRNFLTINNLDDVASIQDLGTNNAILDVSLYPLFQMPNVQPLPRATNATGRTQVFAGGKAGAGATGMAGGPVNVLGGDADGTAGAASGGDCRLGGGAGVNTGPNGRIVMLHGVVHKRQGITYSASMTINSALGSQFLITANNGTAFTINAPTNPVDGQPITITIKNTSGGALGVVTWNAVFKMAAWTSPATGNSRSIQFMYDGTNWVEMSRATADVPN